MEKDDGDIAFFAYRMERVSVKSRTFDPDKAVGKAFEKIPENMRVAFLAALVWGIITHLYMLTNKFPNPDDTRHMFDLGVAIEGGRFGLALLSNKWFNWDVAILSAYSMPWLNGILSISFIGISAAIMVNVLKIQKKISCALIAFIMVAYPTVTGTLHYMFTAPAYFFALFLSVIAVYFGVKSRLCSSREEREVQGEQSRGNISNRSSNYFGRRKVFSIIICEIALVLCLGIYQAYFWVSIGLFILVLFFDSLTDHINGNATVKQIVLDGTSYVLMLVFALAAYGVCNKMILHFTHKDLVQYGGLNDIFSVFNVDIWYYMKLSYLKFFENAWNPVEEGAPFRKILFVIILISGIVQIFIIAKERLRRKSIAINLLLLVIVFILPLGAGSIYIASRQFVHTLMIFSTVLIFVFALTLSDRFIEWEKERYIFHYLYKITGVGVLLLAINYSVIANAVYLGSQITTSQALSLLNRLGMRIEMVDGFDINTVSVAFIGSPNSLKKPQTLSELYSLNNIVGVCFENVPGTDYEENVFA